MTDLISTVDGFEPPRRIFGWALHDGQAAPAKLSIRVRLDGTVVGLGVADRSRADLEHVGDGSIAFDFDCDADLTVTSFAEGRAIVEAVAGDQVLGFVGFGPVFRRMMASDLVAASVRRAREAIATVGPEGMVEAIGHAGMEWSGAARRCYIDFVLALLASETSPDPTVATPTDLEAGSVLRRFESLGNNCEFGLVQRHFGIEQNSLLRWGTCQHGLPGLMDAFRSRFARAGDSVSLSFFGAEYISRDDTHALVFHTGRFEGDIRPEVLLRNEKTRIGYLARNLMEDMENGSKIFVYKDNNEPDEADIVALIDELHTIGPITLLWITASRDAAKVGKVHVMRPGLLRGYIDRFSRQENVHEYCSFDVWLQLCNSALGVLSRADATPVIDRVGKSVLDRREAGPAT